MLYLLIFLLLALFYIILPFLGFFIIGENRNTIRKKIVATRYLPFVESLEDLSLGEKTPGRYFGQIKHINESGLCFSDGRNFLSLNTENLNCYELKIDNLSKKKDLYKLEKFKWEDVIACNNNAGVFITGSFKKEDDKITVDADYGIPLILVFFEGDKKDFWKKILKVSVERPRTINPFSVFSVLTGFFVMLVFTGFIFTQDYSPVLNYTVFAALFFPLLEFLPPGIFGVFLYKYYIKKGYQFLNYSRYIEDQVFGVSVTHRTSIMCDSNVYEIKTVEKPLSEVLYPPYQKLRMEKKDWFSCGMRISEKDQGEPTDIFFESFSLPASPNYLIQKSRSYYHLCVFLAFGFHLIGSIMNMYILVKLLLLILH